MTFIQAAIETIKAEKNLPMSHNKYTARHIHQRLQ